MTILLKFSNKILEADYYIEKTIIPKVVTAEVTSFFWFRKQDTGRFSPAQQYVIQQWEPRVAQNIGKLDLKAYRKLRDNIGISSIKGLSRDPGVKPNKVHDKQYEAREVFDLRDEVSESASSTIRSEECGCGCN
jgi:hypothetical protein